MNARHAAFALVAAVLLAPLAAPVHAQGPAPAPSGQVPSSPVEKAVFDAVARATAGDFKGGLKILEPYRNDAHLLPAGKSLLGYLYVENHQPQDALAVLEPLTHAEQPDAAVLYNAARAAAALKQPAKARPWLQQAAALDPASPAGRDLGMILAREGQAVEAYTLLRAWVPQHPRDGDARLEAASLALVLERPIEAKAFLEGMDATNPAIQLLNAKVHLQLAQPKQALALLEPLMAKHPAAADLEVRRMTAQAYIATGQAAKALSLLQDHTGGDPRSLLVLAMAQNANGNSKAAIATLEPLAKNLPKAGTVGDPRPAAAVAVQYGAMLVAAGRPAEAVPPLQQATQLSPMSEGAWRQLADALDAANRKPEGAKARARADDLAKQAQDKHSAQVAQAQAGQAQAAQGQRPGSPAAPAMSADMQTKVTRFRALMGLQHYGEAEKLATEMLATAPKNPDFLYQMAVVEMAQKRNAAAEKHFQAALQAEPNHVASLDDYSVLLLAQGRNDEARKLVDRALKVNPNDPAAKANLQQLQKPAKPAKG